MARQETDREDLYHELRNAVARCELRHPERIAPIVMGIKKDGRLSIYLSPDHVWHFDSQGRLLRSYYETSLYRTQGTTLAKLDRQRISTKTVLWRNDLAADQLSTLLETFRANLRWLVEEFVCDRFEVLRALPEPFDRSLWLSRIRLTVEFPLRLAPPYPTRRDSG